ncbi:MAG: peptidoglycan-binding domain-containing protein [[Clostridium] innocuum]
MGSFRQTLRHTGLQCRIPCFTQRQPRCLCFDSTGCIKRIRLQYTDPRWRIRGNTRNALVAYQRDNGLSADGVVGCGTWTRIVNEVVGIGRTPTVIDP